MCMCARCLSASLGAERKAVYCCRGKEEQTREAILWQFGRFDCVERHAGTFVVSVQSSGDGCEDKWR